MGRLGKPLQTGEFAFGLADHAVGDELVEQAVALGLERGAVAAILSRRVYIDDSSDGSDSD